MELLNDDDITRCVVRIQRRMNGKLTRKQDNIQQTRNV